MTAQKSSPLQFRTGFIVLPLAFFTISAVLAAAFWGSLPDEVYYRFTTGGDPGSSLVAKGSVVAVVLLIQAALLLLSFLLTWSLGRSRFFNENLKNFWFNPTKLLTLMGNMPAIVQVIIAYALLDIIIYHTQESHLVPLWLFALVTLVLGGVFILVYALPIFLQAWRGFSETDKKE